jgi:hypothetical protein
MGSCLSKNSDMDDGNSEPARPQSVSRPSTLGRTSGWVRRSSTSTSDNTLVGTQSQGLIGDLEPSGMRSNTPNSEETCIGNLVTRTATTHQPSRPRPVQAIQTISGTRSSIYGPFNPPPNSNTRFLRSSYSGAPTPVPDTCSTAGAHSVYSDDDPITF